MPVHAYRDQQPHHHPDVQSCRDCETAARATAEAAMGRRLTPAEADPGPGPYTVKAHEAEARAMDLQIGLAQVADHQATTKRLERQARRTFAVVEPAEAAPTEPEQAQARHQAAHYSFALLKANPELTVREVAHQYAALTGHPDHPDPAVLACLSWLASNTVPRTA
jgi:hypothetical protein